jgi:hypothetical protein
VIIFVQYGNLKALEGVPLLALEDMLRFLGDKMTKSFLGNGILYKGDE